MTAWKDSGCISMQATRVRSLDVGSACQVVPELKPGERLSDVVSGRLVINLRSSLLRMRRGTRISPSSPFSVVDRLFPAFNINTSCFRTDDTSGDAPNPMDPIGQLNPILPHMAQSAVGPP